MKKINQIGAGLLICTVIGFGIGQARETTDSFSSLNLSGFSGQNGVLALSGTNIPSFRSFSDEQLATLVNVLNVTPTLPASALPNRGLGTFWSLQNGWPLPSDIGGLDVWPMSDGSFLLNDINYNYNAAPTNPMGLGTMSDDGVPFPGGSGGGTNSYTPDGSNYTPPDYGTNLWIAQTAVASGYLTGIGSNTLSGVTYSIQSVTNLAQVPSGWQYEGSIVGSYLTNWTPFSVAQNYRKVLSIRLQSELSSDGSGIPDWWELRNGLSNVDPNAQDSAGDGFTIYQKYVLGAAPSTWLTPAAPQGFTVTYNAINNTATLNWLPCPGNVTGYTIYDSLGNHYTVSAAATSLTVSTAALQANPRANGNIQVTYSMAANYGGATSASTVAVPLEAANLAGVIVPGSQGILQLVVSALPAGTAAIQLTEISSLILNNGYTNYYVTNFDISVSNLNNGVCALPDCTNTNETYLGYFPTSTNYEYEWVGRAVGTNGNLGAAVLLANESFTSTEDNESTVRLAPPYYDGRAQLKHNLIFQLRAAPIDSSLHFSIPYISEWTWGPFGAYSGNYLYTSNYVYAGFYQFANNFYNEDPYHYENQDKFDPYLPVEENCLFRNFVFTPSDADENGTLTTGLNVYDVLESPVSYEFQTNWTVFPDLLDTNTARWPFYEEANYPNDLYGSGVIRVNYGDADIGSVTMSGNFCNWFGLPYASANVAYNDNDTGNLATNVVLAGGTTYFADYNVYNVAENNIYPATAQPGFRTVEYDFWN